MRVLIIANFTHNFDEGVIDGRFTTIAEMLSEKGHDVFLMTSDYDHDIKAYRNPVKEGAYKSTIIFCHEPSYKKNISLKRLYSHWVWGKNVAKKINEMGSFDVVYCAIPSFTAARNAFKIASRYNARCIIDIQDLWPEAFTMAVKTPLFHWIFYPMEKYADSVYSKADFVIGVSDTYRDRGLKVNLKGKKGLTVYLGNDGKRFAESKEKYKIDRHDDEFWIGYIGTLGYSYDIACAIEAIAIASKKSNKKIKFIIMGRGPLKEYFEGIARDFGIYCEFTGPLQYEKMVGTLCSCDCVINPIKRGAAQSITNKVGDYALSGLPVINSQENEEYINLVNLYKCGINCECGNAQSVAEAILRLLRNPKMVKEMGLGSKELGDERFDRTSTYQHIIRAIEYFAR